MSNALGWTMLVVATALSVAAVIGVPLYWLLS